MKNCLIYDNSSYNNAQIYIGPNSTSASNMTSTIINCTIYNKNDNNTGNLGGVYLYGGVGGDSIYSNNTIILSDNLSSAFNGATATIDVYILSCVIQGTTNVVDVNVNNIQALTIDTLGIIIQG